MAKTVTTRIDDQYVIKIDEMAAKKGIDRSALLRRFLIKSLKEQTIRDSLEDYQSGAVTLWEAAQQCNLTLWEMMKEDFNAGTTNGAVPNIRTYNILPACCGPLF